MGELREPLSELTACGLPEALEVMGERWSFMILRASFNGLHHFEEFLSELGIARNILSARLETLVQHGIMEKRVYSERPLRHEYVLTPKGKDLWGVMTALRQWGDRWAFQPEEHPVVLVHDECGHVCEAVPHCSECGEELTLLSIHVEPGPGADPGFVPRAPRSTRQ